MNCQFFKQTRRLLGAVVAIVAINSTAGSVQADWHDFWHKFRIDFHRNHAWPDPFNEADAREVVRPFDMMTQNGWKMHNTIGHELFREGDGALLASGSNRLHWIATQAPPSRRSVYVLRGRSQQETDARLASVRSTLSNMHLQGQEPAVMVTNIEPGMASGAWANKISREWIDSIPKPQLPQTSSTGAPSAATPTN